MGRSTIRQKQADHCCFLNLTAVTDAFILVLSLGGGNKEIWKATERFSVCIKLYWNIYAGSRNWQGDGVRQQKLKNETPLRHDNRWTSVGLMSPAESVYLHTPFHSSVVALQTWLLNTGTMVSAVSPRQPNIHASIQSPDPMMFF